jgi:short-subunit dehydrogenase
VAGGGTVSGRPIDLRGAHAVVTGASKGIGRDIARHLAAQGARVTVVARSEAPLKELAAAIGGTAVPADLANPDHLDGLIARIEAETGPVDVLVNNAAVAVVGRLEAQTAAEVRDSFALNTVAPIELCRQVLPGMLDRDRGRITNVSSLAGITAFPTLSTYGATKAGLVQFSAAMQRELRRSEVRCTIVQLGEVAGTEMMEQARQSPTIEAVSRRLARTHALPAVTSELVAGRIVEATAAGRRDVVVPRRVSVMHKIRELPSRMNDVLLLGID